jgi:DNA replication protein DnaC
MEVCPECKGGGWILVRKSTLRTRAAYGDDRLIEYAEPCPYCNGGEQKIVEDIKERANIPATFYDASIENFKWDAYKDDKGNLIDISAQKKFVDSFINNFEKWQEKGLGFYIYSKTRGAGKTFLASCICNSLMVKYKISTKFVSASELINLSKQENRVGEKNPIDVMCECKVLVLDDIGQKTTGEDWMNDLLFKIIDARYQKKLVTLFTSNAKCDELRIDDRVSSRINKIAQNLPLPEVSFRLSKGMDERKEFYKEIGLM